MILRIKPMAQEVEQPGHERQTSRTGRRDSFLTLRSQLTRQQHLHDSISHDIRTTHAPDGPVPGCLARLASAPGPHATEANGRQKTKASVRRTAAQAEQALALGRAAADRVDELRDERYLCLGIGSGNIFRVDQYIHQRAGTCVETKRLKNLSNAVGRFALPARGIVFSNH